VATVEELDRLGALLTQLTPLESRLPGELVRAQDWNTVVGTLIAVVRSLVDDRDAAVAPHQHVDQVSVGWLDPQLRQLIQQGPLGDPAAVARVSALELADTRAGVTIEAIRADVAQLQSRALDLGTRSAEQQSTLSLVNRKVEGLDDAREDVLALRTTLQTVQDKVAEAIELAGRLQVDGQPVDIGALKAQVDAITDLSSRFTLPGGEVLDGPTFERRIAELRAEMVNQQQLDDALANHPGGFDGAAQAALEQRLDERVDGAVAARAEALRAELDAATDVKLASRDARLQELTDLTATLSSRLDAVSTGIDEAIDKRLDARLGDALGELRKLIDGLSGRLDGVSSELEQLATSTKALDARINEMQRSVKEQLARLSESLRGQLDETTKALGGRLDGVEARIRELDARVTRLEKGFDTRLGSALDLHDQALRTEFGGIVNDQIAGLRDELPQLVQASVTPVSEDAIRRIATDTIEQRLRPR
jgi:DNA repair exonuclease SbcCD ATPase subunit